MHKSREAEWRPIVALTLATIACLAPFAAKAIHIDDPLFVWAARHIQSHPGDPYGFSVNWYGTAMPMSQVTNNPPLASYFMALVARILGWSEVALHLAFIIPAIAVVLGTYCFARRLCKQPLLAALAGLATPVFLVSSTTLMCDTFMLALWVWAVVLWIRGIERDEHVSLAVAAFLVGLAALAKYYAASLIPLLALYAAMHKRRIGRWAVHLLIPIAILAWYEVAGHALYGRGLLLDASAAEGFGVALFPKLLISLAFTGGCFLPVTFFAPRLWSGRGLMAGVAVAAVTWVILTHMETLGDFPLRQQGVTRGLIVGQLCVLIVSGIGVMMLALADVRRQRSADTVLLASWIAGTFVFSGFVNWTVSGRSILPMMPAIATLIARRLERVSEDRSRRENAPREKNGATSKRWRDAWPLIPAAISALLVTGADYQLANAGRTAAENIERRYGNAERPIWFVGHWGFQYYMSAHRGEAIDFQKSLFVPGDLIVVPWNNTNVEGIPASAVTKLEVMAVPGSRWLTTMSGPLGAGFYVDARGPLPFAVGAVRPEKYTIAKLNVRD